MIAQFETFRLAGKGDEKLMARRTMVPDPGMVRLLDAAGRQRESLVFDWLTESDRAARMRTFREIAGAFVKTETPMSGKRTANVTVLGPAMGEPLMCGGFEQILATATNDGARTIRFHVLKSEANAEIVGWLFAAGFRPKQGLVHWIAPAGTNALAGHDVRRIGPDEAPEFARIVGINYRYKTDQRVAALVHETRAPNVASFLAYVDGAAVGTGLVHEVGSICDLGYGTTLKPYRGHGIQQAIIAARVQYARSIGCEWATACTMGFDRSSRNLVRQGFRQAYIMSDYERAE